MTSTTENPSEKRTRNQFTEEKLYLLIEAYPMRQFFFLFACFSHIQSVQARDKIPYLSVRLWSLKQC